jgi:hypothetical protein
MSGGLLFYFIILFWMTVFSLAKKEVIEEIKEVDMDNEV